MPDENAERIDASNNSRQDHRDGKPLDPFHSWLGLIVFLVVCFSAAGVGGTVTTPKIAGWYAALAKPSWNPPNGVFGPVWSFLFLSMALAAWMVWKQGRAFLPLTVFGVQLVLNVAWSCLFFGLESPGLALGDIFLLEAAILATIVLFWRKDKLAGALLMPYAGWVAFATVLNFAIWRLSG